MSSAYLAPVNSEFVSKLISRLCLGDESNLLSKVKVNFFLAIDSLDFDQTNTVVLGPKSALVTKDCSVNMKAWWSGRHDSVSIRNKSASQQNRLHQNKNTQTLKSSKNICSAIPTKDLQLDLMYGEDKDDVRITQCLCCFASCFKPLSRDCACT